MQATFFGMTAAAAASILGKEAHIFTFYASQKPKYKRKNESSGVLRHKSELLRFGKIRDETYNHADISVIAQQQWAT